MNCLDGLYCYITICVSKSASRVFLKGEYESPIACYAGVFSSFLLDPGPCSLFGIFVAQIYLCTLLGYVRFNFCCSLLVLGKGLHGIQLGS
jgi:hypothetical protein